MAILAAMLTGAGQSAHGQNPPPGAPAPARTYQAVPIILPNPAKDPALDSFRNQLAAAARKRMEAISVT